MVLWNGPQLRQQWVIYRDRFNALAPAQKVGIVVFLLFQLLVLAYIVRSGGGKLMHGA